MIYPRVVGWPDVRIFKYVVLVGRPEKNFGGAVGCVLDTAQMCCNGLSAVLCVGRTGLAAGVTAKAKAASGTKAAGPKKQTKGPPHGPSPCCHSV